MSSTRRQTPIAPAPMRPAAPAEAGRAHVLKAPIVVVTPNGEWDHERGSIVIGRGDDANVVVADPLVSRVHARLTVLDDERVVIEDLTSTNGVFVNGVRLARPTTGLSEGDRLLIGTTEISVFSTRASATMPIKPRVAKPEPQAVGAASSGRLRLAATVPKRPLATTERSEAVELVGRLAEHFMSSGLPNEAIRVLSEHLNTLLLGASAGLAVPAPLLEHATRYAIVLHGWTERASWIDYSIELHAACQQIPSDVTLTALERVYPNVSGTDPGLVAYLLRTLESKAAVRSEDDARRLVRLAGLVPR